MGKSEKRSEFAESLKVKKTHLNQKDRWLQNMWCAGEVHSYLSPKKDVHMSMHDCKKNTKIFSPNSRGWGL